MVTINDEKTNFLRPFSWVFIGDIGEVGVFGVFYHSPVSIVSINIAAN
jgi:hypothetical protein